MHYKHKCTSVRELVETLEEVVRQIRDHRSIIVDWQEVAIPEETVLKVRYKEEENTRQLKLKIEWGSMADLD